MAGGAHLKPEENPLHRSAGNSRSGSHSLTTIALDGGFRTSFIPTPFGQIGLVVPVSFPPAEETALLEGLNFYFKALPSGEGAD